MRQIEAADLDSVRGGEFYQEPRLSETGEWAGGSWDVGSGYVLTEYSMSSLDAEEQYGTDEIITSLAQSIHFAGTSVGGGAYYTESIGASPPPNFYDIYNSIPGAPKEKFRRVKAGTKIC